MAPLSRAVALLFLAFSACTSGSTGPSTGGQAGDPGEPPCGVVHDEQISPDEVTPLGFRVQDVLPLLEGTYDGILNWNDGDASDITLWVEDARGFRFEDVEPAPAEEGGEEASCDDVIAMQFTLLFTTADGEFDEESGPGDHVRATSVDPDAIRIHAEFYAQDFAGSYDVGAEVDPAIVDAASPPYLIVSGTLDSIGLEASLTLSFRSRPGEEFPDGSTATSVHVGDVSASRLP